MVPDRRWGRIRLESSCCSSAISHRGRERVYAEDFLMQSLCATRFRALT
jgi:hypothetical protein